MSVRVCECKSVDFCVRQCMGDRVNANIVRGRSLLCIFLHFLLKSGFGPALIIVVRNNFPDRYFDCALVWSFTELLRKLRDRILVRVSFNQRARRREQSHSRQESAKRYTAKICLSRHAHSHEHPERVAVDDVPRGIVWEVAFICHPSRHYFSEFRLHLLR